MKLTLLAGGLALVALAGCGETLASLRTTVVESTGLDPAEVDCIAAEALDAALTTKDAVTVQKARDVAAACGLELDVVVKDAVDAALATAVKAE